MVNNNDLSTVFAKNFNHYLKVCEKTKQDISDLLNIPYRTVLSWATGDSYPRMNKIEALANLFGIRKSDLIEDKEKLIPSPQDEVWEIRAELQQRPELKVLFDMSKKATKEDVEKAIQMMEIITNARRD